MVYLSVVIPAYNEEARLPATLEQVGEYLAAQQYTSEVIVVNDGSTDKTAQLVEKWQKKLPNLILINNAKNQGKGAVVRQGMLAARGEHRLFMDADSSTTIDQVKGLLDVSSRYDIVVGSRYIRPDSIKVKQPLRRRIISRASNLLIQMLVLPGIKDTQCGFKLFSAAAAETVFPRQTMNGWMLDVELLSIARKQGLRIGEVAVEWRDAKNSTLRAAQAVTSSLRDLLIIRSRLDRGFYS